MSGTSEHEDWSVEIYQVLNHDRQQRVLEAFRDLARADVKALGTQRGRDWFVVVETGSWDGEFVARSAIAGIDVHAARRYSFTTPRVLGPLPAS